MIRSPLASLSPRARMGFTFAFWTLLAVGMGIFLVTFVARSYSVHGVSMEPTLRGGDVVFTNKLPYTIAAFTGSPHVPARGSLVVFKNPFYNQGDPDMFIVKRVIGLPGDRVIVSDGRIAIHPAEDSTRSINPDNGITGPQSPTAGNVNRIVPDGELFVAGDNRLGKNSLDSRNGMSTVPLRELEGTVILRLWPLNQLKLF